MTYRHAAEAVNHVNIQTKTAKLAEVKTTLERLSATLNGRSPDFSKLDACVSLVCDGSTLRENFFSAVHLLSRWSMQSKSCCPSFLETLTSK